MDEIAEEFNNRMNDLYADRDCYSRGKIIELAKQHFKEVMDEGKSIDKVTPTNLDIALRIVGIQISKDLLDNIIDLVELIEDKGGEATLKDVLKLQSKWTQN